MSVIVQTGYKLPTAVISNGFTTGNEWSNPNNILLVDTDTANSNQGSGTASDIIIGNFNFNVPENSVITGIQIKVIGYEGQQSSPVLTLSPVAVDNTSGENEYYAYQPPYTGLTTELDEHVLGSSSYLFATSWTVDQINNLKLQLLANGPIYLDSVLVNVYYYTPSSDEPEPIEDGLCETCESDIQAQPFVLALPVTQSSTGIYLKSFNLPNGIPITMNDLGECGGTINIVMDQGKPKGNGNPFEENARVIDIIPQPNGTIFLDFGSSSNRGLGYVTPFTYDADNVSEHNANSEVVISNNGPWTDKLLKKCHIGVLVSPPITVRDEGVVKTDALSDMNFTGQGVSVNVDPNDPTKINVVIPGAGGTNPPIIDSTSSATSGDEQVDSLTWEHTVAGVNRALVVQVSTEEDQTITGITFNGVALSQVVSETDNTNNIRQEQWILVAPSLGTHDIVISLSGDAYISAGAESFAGVDQDDPTGQTETATGDDNEPTLDLTTDYDNSIIIDGLATALTPILYTVGAGQVENWHETANISTRQGGSSYELSGSSPDVITMDWSITQSTDWVLTAIELRGIEVPSGGGGGDVDLTVIQNSHGFVEGDILKSAGVDGVYAKAQADSAQNAEVVGIVKTVVDVNTFVLSKDAYYSGDNIPAGTPGAAVFLDPATAGEMTMTIPVTAGQVVKPLGVILTSGALMTFTADSRGEILSGPTPGSTLTVEEEGTPVDTEVVVINFTGLGVTATQTSPGEVEVNIPGGGGSSLLVSEQRLGGDNYTGPGSGEYPPHMSTTNADGTVLYTFGTASFKRYAKDANTGLYYVTHSTGGASTDWKSMVVVGSYIYLMLRDDTFPNAVVCYRYLAADLTGSTTMTFSPSAPNGYSFDTRILSYTDGTFIYILDSTETVFLKFSISGTTLTYVSSITGFGGISGGIFGAHYSSGILYTVSNGGRVGAWSETAGVFTLDAQTLYTIPQMGVDDIHAYGIGYGSSLTLTLFFRVNQYSTSGAGSSVTERKIDETILKVFSKPN